MALINIPTDHIKLRKTLSFEKKPLMMLKDYLRDDLSSCSSSGFKAFPRRQCCTTVRFLLEADLKKSKEYSSSTRKLLRRSTARSNKPASTTISALQRASEAVLNAVKLLPFPSVKSSSSSLQSSSSRKGILPRSFSRKLFKRSFWRKVEKEDAAGEIRRWRLFREFLEEKNQPSDQNTISISITNANTTDSTSSTIITTTTTTSRVSTSTSSNSWAESEFTADVLQSSSGNSGSSSENDVVQGKTGSPEAENKVSSGNTIGVTVGEEDSINYAKVQEQEQDWRNQEEVGKEQFSPVSVLDCPFDDEEDTNTSPNFQYKLARVQGTKQKLMQKLRRFESLAQLEPVDLEKRIALMSELEDDHQSPNLSTDDESQQQQKHTSETTNIIVDVDELLKVLKAQIPSHSTLTFKADKLLIDLFGERVVVGELDNGHKNKNKNKNSIVIDQVEVEVLLKVAEDWMNGNPQEVILGWEVEEGRKLYVQEMERNSNNNWRKFEVEKEEIGSEIELEVFTWLLDEFLTDLYFN